MASSLVDAAAPTEIDDDTAEWLALYGPGSSEDALEEFRELEREDLEREDLEREMRTPVVAVRRPIRQRGSARRHRSTRRRTARASRGDPDEPAPSVATASEEATS
jgi:hypothetical protein